MPQNDTSDDESDPPRVYLNPNSHIHNNSGIFYLRELRSLFISKPRTLYFYTRESHTESLN